MIAEFFHMITSFTINPRVAYVLLALAGCAQVATSQGQAPYTPYRRDNEGMNRGPDM